jgi:hypothetical protein
LHRDDVLTGGALLPLAVGSFLAANLAALRSRPHGTEELEGSLLASPAQRTVAHLLAGGWAAGVALLAVGAALLSLAVRGPVGVPSAWELLAGPAVVWLCAALGVLVARWWPTAAAGPVALVPLSAAQLHLTLRLSATVSGQSRARWLAPWAPLSNSGNPPPELVFRPSGWHLVYLLGLALLAGGLALVRHGAGVRPAAVVGARLALTLAAAVQQARPPSPERVRAMVALVDRPRTVERCEVRGGVRYCFYPAYRPWLERWAQVIGPVVSAVPPAARPGTLEVWQVPSQVFGSDLPTPVVERLTVWTVGQPFRPERPPGIHVGTRWLGGAAGRAQQLSLAAAAGAWAVGLPMSPNQVLLTRADARRILQAYPPEERATQRRQVHEGAVWGSCNPRGQARAVVALWLAARATPETREAFRTALSHPFGFEFTLPVSHEGAGNEDLAFNLGFAYANLDVQEAPGGESPVSWPREEAEYAAQLLDRPGGQVAAALARHWDRLTRPEAPTKELVRLFGLRPVPPVAARLARVGIDPEVAARVASELEGGGEVPCR